MKFIKRVLGFTNKRKCKKARVYKAIDKRRNINNTAKQKLTNFLADLFNIYGDSRLPEKPDDLIKQGWEDKTHPVKKKYHHGKTYIDSETNQIVDFDYGDSKLNSFEIKIIIIGTTTVQQKRILMID